MSQNQNSMTVRALYAALETRIPRTLSCDWDNDGLACCPAPDAPVRGILVALDPTEDAVEKAIEIGCNVILAHHPLLFRGLKAVDGHDTSSRKVIRMITAGISAMAFHTRLDAVEGGVNDVLAARLGLSDLTPFGDDGNPAKMPIGRVGTLPEDMTLDAFAALVRDALAIPEALGSPYTEHLTPAVPAVSYVGCGRPVRRVAVLGGSGQDDLEAAAAIGADTYVTGELRYHQLCDAPYGTVNLVRAGHFFTEFPVCRRLADLAAELCPDTPIHILGETREQSV